MKWGLRPRFLEEKPAAAGLTSHVISLESKSRDLHLQSGTFFVSKQRGVTATTVVAVSDHLHVT